MRRSRLGRHGPPVSCRTCVCWSPAAGASSARTSSSGCARDGVEPFVPRRRDYDLDGRRATPSGSTPTRGPSSSSTSRREVGGIGANRANPGRYLYDNLMMGAQCIEQSRVARGREARRCSGRSAPIRSSRRCRSARTISGTAIPRRRTRPTASRRRCCSSVRRRYREQYGLNAIYLLPVNLYGPRDNFDLETSHVIPALIRKMVDAQERGDARDRPVGRRHRRRASSSTSTTAPKAIWLAARALRRPRAGQPRHRRGDLDPRPRASSSPSSRASRARSSGTRRSRTASRAASSTSRAPRSGSASAQRTPLREGLERTVAWYRQTAATALR